MRQELNLGPCPLRVRPKKLPCEAKRQATLFRDLLLRTTSSNSETPLCICSCFFRVAKGEDIPYEVHLVYRDQFLDDQNFVRYVCNHPPKTWDKKAKAAIRKLKHDN